MGRIYIKATLIIPTTNGKQYISTKLILFDSGCLTSIAFEDLLPNDILIILRSPINMGLGGQSHIITKQCIVSVHLNDFKFATNAFIYPKEGALYTQESEYGLLKQVLGPSPNHRYRIDFVIGALSTQANNLVLFPSIHGIRIATSMDHTNELWFSLDEKEDISDWENEYHSNDGIMKNKHKNIYFKKEKEAFCE